MNMNPYLIINNLNILAKNKYYVIYLTLVFIFIILRNLLVICNALPLRLDILACRPILAALTSTWPTIYNKALIRIHIYYINSGRYNL